MLKTRDKNGFYVNITKARNVLNIGFFEKVNKIKEMEVPF